MFVRILGAALGAAILLGRLGSRVHAAADRACRSPDSFRADRFGPTSGSLALGRIRSCGIVQADHVHSVPG